MSYILRNLFSKKQIVDFYRHQHSINTSLALTCAISFTAIKIVQSNGNNEDDKDISDTAKWRLHTDIAKTNIIGGKLSTAQENLKKALEHAKRGFGEKDSHVAAACNNLAELYRMQKKYNEAKILLNQALDILLLNFGETDLRTAVAQHNLAVVMHLEGDYKGAEKMLNRALKTRHKILGKGHLESLSSMIAMVNVKFDMKNKKECQKLLKEIIILIKDKNMEIASLDIIKDVVILKLKLNDKEDLDILLNSFKKILEYSEIQHQSKILKVCDELMCEFSKNKEFSKSIEICELCEKSISMTLGENSFLYAVILRKKALMLISNNHEINDKDMSVIFEIAQKSLDILKELWINVTNQNKFFIFKFFNFNDKNKPQDVLKIAIEIILIYECLIQIGKLMNKGKEFINDKIKESINIIESDYVNVALDEIENKFEEMKHTVMEKRKILEKYKIDMM